ncbi:MAG: hypothetical protein U5K81_08065 [Trueperaceae bacterium]|nr:hypothetical protein [Trueperaceae bacterium]
MWAATYGSNDIMVFEPVDYSGNGSGGGGGGSLDRKLQYGRRREPLGDEDGDGYTNADEIDNGTNPCSAASTPPDFDGDGVSDLLDPKTTTTTVMPDATDRVRARMPTTAPPLSLPVEYDLFWNDDPGIGFGGLGFTGLMTNGTAITSTLFDPDDDLQPGRHVRTA